MFIALGVILRIALVLNLLVGAAIQPHLVISRSGLSSPLATSRPSTSMTAMGNWYESQSNTVYSKYYYHNGVRIAVRRTGYASNNGLFWLLTDHLGGTNVTLDSSGNRLTELRYYPFGDTRYSLPNQLTNYRFTGQWLDYGPNIYFYGSRWYDPTIGRFLQADTIVPDPGNSQAFNRYAYTLNNPLRYTDPSGHVPDPYCAGYAIPDCGLEAMTPKS
ncbi:MAG: RHS repeat-associated core domain-containing protein [Anaerolineae bacterium]|nr:RHS repeat-associated core domain-containing protein [Anaerolineae bacterium]